MTHKVYRNENYLLILDEETIDKHAAESIVRVMAHLPIGDAEPIEGVALLPPLSDEKVPKAFEKVGDVTLDDDTPLEWTGDWIY